MGPAAGALGIVALFGLAGLVTRWLAHREAVRESRPVPPPLPEETAAVAVSAEGWRFVADTGGVRILPPGDLEAMWPVRAPIGTDWNLLVFLRSTPMDPRTHAPVASWVPGVWLAAGDLVGARLSPAGGDGEPAWWLEALGRDRDYRAWPFADPDEARAALAMVLRRVVRRPAFDPRPWPPQAEDFERALRERMETWREVTELTGAATGGWTWSVAGGGWLSS